MRTLALLLTLGLVALLAAACRDASPGGPGPATATPSADLCAPASDPRLLLQCEEFSQDAYWLGPEFDVPGAAPLVLASAYVDDGDEPISSDSRLVLVYGPRSGTDLVYLSEWHRPAWESFLAGFTGYDPSVIPESGPVNWWQHPCVEEAVYTSSSGAEVHLFRAHFTSLIYIPPMTPEEVSRCPNAPVGALGAHVYFGNTVVEFSVQDQTGPDEPPEGPTPIAPGTTPPPAPSPSPPPPPEVRAENPYNDEAIVRRIADALRPYASE